MSRTTDACGRGLWNRVWWAAERAADGVVVMTGLKPSLAVGTSVLLGLAVWANGYYDASAGQMATAAGRVLASLDKDQAEKAVFAYDSPERLNWHFIPRERKG